MKKRNEMAYETRKINRKWRRSGEEMKMKWRGNIGENGEERKWKHEKMTIKLNGEKRKAMAKMKAKMKMKK